MSGEGRSLTLESDEDDGVVLGLGIYINLHKFFSDKTVLSVCVDAGLHKVLVRNTKPVLVVDAVYECLSKVSLVEERLEWEINQGVKEVEVIIVMHQETFIGSSPCIIEFDVGQRPGDAVDLSSGVLRVACMMLM